MNAARPRYASVLPPPVGKNSRSTTSRSACVGSAIAAQVHQQERELERPPRRRLDGRRARCRCSCARRWRAAIAIARLARRNASKHERIVEQRDAGLDAPGRALGALSSSSSATSRCARSVGGAARCCVVDPRRGTASTSAASAARSAAGVGERGQRLHAELDAGDRRGLDALDLGRAASRSSRPRGTAPSDDDAARGRRRGRRRTPSRRGTAGRRRARPSRRSSPPRGLGRARTAGRPRPSSRPGRRRPVLEVVAALDRRRGG